MKSAVRLSERLYGILLGLRSRINLSGKSGTFLYAVCAGVLAALVATVFQKSTQFILATLTGTEGGRFVATFQQIPDWRKIFALAVGGAISGLILLFASQKVKKKATPYMEAVAIGNGYIPVRPNLLRSLAAIITIGSGASIGREGPLVQTVTVFASLFGRKMNVPLPRLRLLIACAAAGGMSAVFHTPLAGGLFVCEIVIGVMSIDILAPLLVSSCASYITIMTISNPAPLYSHPIYGGKWLCIGRFLCERSGSRYGRRWRLPDLHDALQCSASGGDGYHPAPESFDDCYLRSGIAGFGDRGYL